MKRLTTLLLALTGVTTLGCVATVGGNECTSERCEEEEPGSGSATARDCSDPDDVEIEGANGGKNITITSDADFAKLPDGCWALNGTLRLQGSAVTSVEKLGDLVDVNNLEIVDTQLATFDSLQQVTVYGHIRVSNNSKLTSFERVTATKWTGSQILAGDTTQYFQITDNAELANINGLKYLQSVGADLQIERNPKLASFELVELQSISGALTIKESGVTSVKLPMLETVTSIEIAQNPQLSTFSGLAAATIGNVTFRQNAKLAQIGSMSSLNMITGNLIIDDNDTLADLYGLTSSLQRIVGQVTVSNNQVLTNLGQLSRLSLGIGLTVTVTSNPVLGYCKAYELDRCVSSGTVTNTGNGSQQSCTTWCP
jgi:hypothetical protein